MSRSYRSIIFAVVGWLIVAAAPTSDKGAKPEAGQPSQSVERSLDAIVGAQKQIAKATDTGEYQKPCGKGEQNEQSDLCAQWYAASAARDAADWAFWSLAISIVGAFGIVAALILTIDSNKIARDTAKRQLRAYVTLEGGRLRYIDEDRPIEVELTFKNSGQTPAHKSYVVGGMFVADYPAGKMLFNSLEDHARRPITVGPSVRFFKKEKGAMTQTYRRKLKANTAILYIYGQVIYFDIFGEEHTTNYRFFCGGGHPSWLTQEEGKAVGRLAPADEGNESD